MNDPFSSLPAIALQHRHFKTSHGNKCTATSCLWFSSISPAPLLLPDIPFLPPHLGKHRRVGGTQHWQTTRLFWSHSSALRMKSLVLTSLPPHPSRNFLSPNAIHPRSKTLKAGADSGDKKAVCSHVSSLWQISCSESAR